MQKQIIIVRSLLKYFFITFFYTLFFAFNAEADDTQKKNPINHCSSVINDKTITNVKINKNLEACHLFFKFVFDKKYYSELIKTNNQRVKFIT